MIFVKKKYTEFVSIITLKVDESNLDQRITNRLIKKCWNGNCQKKFASIVKVIGLNYKDILFKLKYYKAWMPKIAFIPYFYDFILAFFAFNVNRFNVVNGWLLLSKQLSM